MLLMFVSAEQPWGWGSLVQILAELSTSSTFSKYP